MTNIRLYASLLEELIHKEENMFRQEEALVMTKELIRQTEKLEFLIQSLTKMSRLESNIVTVRPERQKIAPLLSEVLEEAAMKAEKKEYICGMSIWETRRLLLILNGQKRPLEMWWIMR